MPQLLHLPLEHLVSQLFEYLPAAALAVGNFAVGDKQAW